MSVGLKRAERVFGRASGWLVLAAVLAGLAVGCGPEATAPPAAPAAGSADAPLHPLARRQAEAQAQQAPTLQQAQDAAALPVAGAAGCAVASGPHPTARPARTAARTSHPLARPNTRSARFRPTLIQRPPPVRRSGGGI